MKNQRRGNLANWMRAMTISRVKTTPEHLVAEQGVKPVTRLEDVGVGEPNCGSITRDFEGFLAATEGITPAKELS